MVHIIKKKKLFILSPHPLVFHQLTYIQKSSLWALFTPHIKQLCLVDNLEGSFLNVQQRHLPDIHTHGTSTRCSIHAFKNQGPEFFGQFCNFTNDSKKSHYVFENEK